MSTEMTMPDGGARGIRVRLAVALALPLARLRPDRLRRVLGVLARGARPAPYETALTAYASVVATSRRCAGWYGCLPRSLAVALLCRLTGTWPTWHAGVRATPPFAPHAWVTAQGRMVGERASQQDYRPLMSVTPGRGGGVGRVG
ncbi:lasso peptide biosynthesis B2 protein [Streptomyces sp. NPDC051684]|uniref:lasso peptide biosynthesis B2 protein n=1 Tax=Streptomyces sp. NPDC051684 TaxID=3365670 RepID=UPI0037BBFA1E